jgi:signal transduction histidine kinase
MRLQQVLVNLLGNAVKFTSRGSVSLHVSLASLEDQYTELGFAVKDTGVGLSEEQRRRLFKPFSQADVSSTRVYGGTGLGLVISQRLVQAMRSLHAERGSAEAFRPWVMRRLVYL